MAEEKKRRSKTARFIRRTLFRLAVAALLLAIAGGGILWAQHIIISRQVQVVTAQEGSLAVPREVDALVVNSETVVTTAAAGKIDKVIVEGDRAAKGSLIARILSQGTSLSLANPGSGLISYRVDGLEGVLTPKNLLEWDMAKFKDLKPSPPPGDTVQSGQAVFKVVDNLLPTYLVFNQPQDGVVLAVGDSVAVELGGQKYNAKVVKIGKTGPADGVAAALNTFLPQSLGKRYLKVSLLDKKPAKGEVIPVSALLERQGGKGVFRVKDGVVSWQPVQVLAQSGDKVCVSGLKNGDAVITTPAYVKDGQVVNIVY